MEVVVLHGTPLSGKSLLAYELKRRSNLMHLDVDEIRQELYPNPDRILLPAAEERFVMMVSYTTLAAQAFAQVREGREVLLTGTFSRQEFKAPLKSLYEVLVERQIPFNAFLLTASDEEIERRIEERKRSGSPSNIDSLEKFRWAKGFFQPIDFAPVTEIDTERPIDEVVQDVLRNLNY